MVSNAFAGRCVRMGSGGHLPSLPVLVQGLPHRNLNPHPLETPPKECVTLKTFSPLESCAIRPDY